MMTYTWPPSQVDMTGVETRLDELGDIAPRGISHTEYHTHQHEHVDQNTQTWLDIEDPVIVLSFEFRCNHRLCQPHLQPKWLNTSAEAVRIPRLLDATGAFFVPDPRWLNGMGGKGALMELTQWAPDGGGDFGEFTVKLEKPLVCPTGLRVRSAGRQGETTITASTLVLGFFS